MTTTTTETMKKVSGSPKAARKRLLDLCHRLNDPEFHRSENLQTIASEFQSSGAYLYRLHNQGYIINVDGFWIWNRKMLAEPNERLIDATIAAVNGSVPRIIPQQTIIQEDTNEEIKAQPQDPEPTADRKITTLPRPDADKPIGACSDDELLAAIRDRGFTGFLEQRRGGRLIAG